MLISFYSRDQHVLSFEPSVEEYPDKSLKINVPLQLSSALAEPICITISSKTLNSMELLALPSIVQSLNNGYTIESIDLFVTYLPNARQDRATGDSPCTLDSATALILNSCNFNTITCLDVHSEAAKRFIPNLKVIEQTEVAIDYLTQVGILSADTIAILPDGGAEKYITQYGLQNTLQLEKQRDPRTGYIIFSEEVSRSPSLEGISLEGRSAVMFDDIGASCVTHKLAAHRVKALGISHVTLVLSHAFLTKGAEYLTPEIDKVFFVNNMAPILEVQKLPKSKENLHV